MKNNKVCMAVQARMGSKRLPGKAAIKIAGKPFIARVLERVKKSRLTHSFFLAVPDTGENDIFTEYAERSGFVLCRGSEDDVLGRFYACLSQEDRKSGPLDIVRVAADNPLIDPLEIDRLISYFQKGDYDYAFNHIPALDNGYPDGLGAEILSFSLLEYMHRNALTNDWREHATKFIWDNRQRFRMGVLKAPENIRNPELKFDIDTEEDLKRINVLYKSLYERYGERIYSAKEIVDIAKAMGSSRV
jgi:spore coat polysaccharide biosynthesis protein SpsF